MSELDDYLNEGEKLLYTVEGEAEYLAFTDSRAIYLGFKGLKTTRDINKVISGDIKDYGTSIPALKTGEAIIDSSDFINPLTIKIAPSKSKKN